MPRVTRKKKLNRTPLNVALDLILALIMIVEMEEGFTGLPLHEVLGLIFGVGIILHLLLHWEWIVSLTRTLFKKVIHESRVNYALNLALFISMLVATVTGIMISRTLGLNFNAGRDWQKIHIIASELSLVIVGLHVGLHWKWILPNSRKYIFDRLPSIRKSAPSQEVSA